MTQATVTEIRINYNVSKDDKFRAFYGIIIMGLNAKGHLSAVCTQTINDDSSAAYEYVHSCAKLLADYFGVAISFKRYED